MTQSDPGKKVNDFLHHLEEQAQDHALLAIRLNCPEDRWQGLCLLSREATPAEVLAALPTAFRGQSTPELSPVNPVPTSREPAVDRQPSGVATFSDQRRFLEVLTSELDRVRETRLPCSLLLLEADGLAGSRAWSEAEQYAAIAQHLALEINACLRETDILIHYDLATLAIILPATNLRRAAQCARRIWQTAGRTPLPPHSTTLEKITTSIGIAICFADAPLTAEDLFDLAAKELEQARRQGGNQICQASGMRPANSCQVSVEERAQLFSFFQKDADT